MSFALAVTGPELGLYSYGLQDPSLPPTQVPSIVPTNLIPLFSATVTRIRCQLCDEGTWIATRTLADNTIEYLCMDCVKWLREETAQVGINVGPGSNSYIDVEAAPTQAADAPPPISASLSHAAEPTHAGAPVRSAELSSWC